MTFFNKCLTENNRNLVKTLTQSLHATVVKCNIFFHSFGQPNNVIALRYIKLLKQPLPYKLLANIVTLEANNTFLSALQIIPPSAITNKKTLFFNYSSSKRPIQLRKFPKFLLTKTTIFSTVTVCTSAVECSRSTYLL